jgi:FkbM family methyltransferase
MTSRYPDDAWGVVFEAADARRVKLCTIHSINLVLDIGANTGQYATRLRDAGYAERIVSFEPASAAFRLLSETARGDRLWTTKHLALGARSGDARLNVSESLLASSFLNIGPRHVALLPSSRTVSSELVPMGTIDEVWDDVVSEGDRVYLKMDVQGFELQVLAGASRSLADVALLEAELSLRPLYDGAPPYTQVVSHLAQVGFRLVSLQEGPEDPQTGEMLEFDGIFANEALLNAD